MKKVIMFAAVCALTLSAAGCKAETPSLSVVKSAAAGAAQQQETPPAPTKKPTKSGTVEVKEKMFIAQTNDIYVNSGDYLGKTIKIEGMWLKEEYDDAAYCYVYRMGPGCCGADGFAGFMVGYDGEEPSADDWIEVVGTLEECEVDGLIYLRIACSSLTVMDERGEAYVYQ